MPRLSNSVLQMKGSGIREVMNLAATMKDVIHLEVGEPSFETPPHIVEAACRAARDGFTKYTPTTGYLSLRERLVRKLERVNGLRVSPANIVVTAGSVGALTSAVRAVVEPGDEILLPDPGWPNYEMMAIVCGAIVRRYPLDPANSFLPDMARLEKEITPRTRAILINSPSNPCGAVFPRAIVRQLVDVARRHDLFLVSDEVYEEIVFDGEHVSAGTFDTDGRVIGVYAFSKTYAMTGWRLGYLVASEEVTAAVSKLQQPIVTCPPSISQKAAEAALDGPQDCVAEMCAAYKQRRDLASNLLADAGVPFSRPSGAFYLMIDVSAKGTDSYSFAKELLRTTGVATAPGETFGPSASRYIRISLAASEEDLTEGIERIASFLHS